MSDKPDPLPLKFKEKEKLWKGPLKITSEGSSELTEKQAAFARYYASNGGNGAQAARDAGYSEANAKDQASELLAMPKIREAIELSRDISIKTSGASKAWAVIDSLMTDPAAPAQVRFQAAKWTLEASGHGLSAVAASLHLGMKRSGKPLSEMSVSELEEFINRGRATFDHMKTTVSTVMKAHEAAHDAIELPKEQGDQ
jgi:hypothetical protein